MNGPPAPSPQDIAFDVPVLARCYDYCLGGKDNFAADRDAVLGFLNRFPEGLDVVRENRLFLIRVVRYLSTEVGIDQFIDIGTGMPTVNSVHEVAQRVRPEARVVYVDKDPMVLTHGRALLAKGKGTEMIHGDLLAPDTFLDTPEIRRLIDFDRPVAVLCLSFLHSVLEDAPAATAMTQLVNRLAPGSHIALSHFSSWDTERIEEARELTRRNGLELRWRAPEAIGRFLIGLKPVEPGLVDVAQWRPDPEQEPLGEVDEALRPYLGAAARQKHAMAVGGVARKTD